MTVHVPLKICECKTFSAGLLLADDNRYFLYESTSGRRWLTPADCPHRGGPLNFGSFESGRCVLRCPWHRMPWSESVLIKRSVPAVRVSAQWIAVMPDAPAAYDRASRSNGGSAQPGQSSPACAGGAASGSQRPEHCHA
jgi:hypothetical protein